MDESKSCRMPSRRNLVIRRGAEVEKRFRDSQDLEREAAVYERLEGTGLAPRLLAREEDRLLLEYLPGQTLFEAMEQATGHRRRQEVLLGLFFDWYRAFHAATGLILGDSSFRNFLVSEEGRLVGLDFETCKKGAPAEDAAWQAAMLATLRPPFSRDRMQSARLFLARAPLDLFGPTQKLVEILPEALHQVASRRLVAAKAQATTRLLSAVEVDACILAGGHSSRMGRDKRNLPLGESSFLQNAADKLQLYATRLVSLAAGDDLPLPPGFKAVLDQQEDQGPAEGILRALEAASGTYLLLIPCDMPLLPRALLDQLCDQRTGDHDAICFSEEGVQRLFPLLLRRETALETFSAGRSRGIRKLSSLLSAPLKLRLLPAEHCSAYRPGVLSNINTPEDYANIPPTHP